MKCRQCGSSLSIQDEQCAYCGAGNPYWRQYRAEMSHVKLNYEKTREEVIQKSRKVAGISVKITLIAVLAFLDILFIFLAVNSWSVAGFFREQKAEKEADIHRAALEEYERERDYLGLAAYYQNHDLYGVEGVEDFYYVYRICITYSYLYTDILRLSFPEDYLTAQERIESISENLSDFYSSLEINEYEPEENYTGEHGKLAEQIEEDAAFMLRAYTHITAEEAQAFPAMSDARRQLAMERGLGLDED